MHLERELPGGGGLTPPAGEGAGDPPSGHSAEAPPGEHDAAEEATSPQVQAEHGGPPREEAPAPGATHEPEVPGPVPSVPNEANPVRALVNLVKAGLGLTAGGSTDNFGRDAALAEQLKPLGDFLYERYWRVRVEGAAAVPTGPCILVANHAGVLPVDGPVLYAALRRERPDLPEPRWLVEDAVFHAAFLGPLLHRLGALRASPENAHRVLHEGRPLIVFPEGNLGTGKAWADRYQLQRLGRGGFVKIALQAGVPIVPVAVVGSEETSPLLARIPAKAVGLPWIPVTGPLPLPARWHLRFSAPITPADLGTPEDVLAARVQHGTELTRAAIQGMLDAMLAEREDPFR